MTEQEKQAMELNDSILAELKLLRRAVQNNHWDGISLFLCIFLAIILARSC